MSESAYPLHFSLKWQDMLESEIIYFYNAPGETRSRIGWFCWQLKCSFYIDTLIIFSFNCNVYDVLGNCEKYQPLLPRTHVDVVR